MKVVLVSAGLALALCGCSTELDGFGAKPSAVAGNRVLAAPTGAVESAPAPENVSTATAETATGAITPRTAANNVPLTPPTANPGGNAYAPSAAQGQLSGAWSFSWDSGRNVCPVRLGTDRGLSGLSAQADVSCPSEIFMTKGWDMMGSDIVLQNHQGKVTARLQPSGPNRYVGVIADTGQQVALSR
ncbi:protease inhibitor Inh/omp19 family protein [Xanthobacter dioxanivorans]|uniref:Protease inhibitor Inh/omp19 family protein n=1 Tax=Xanthobacter dioxanivorans TaxID=2528964 RepID=A0A974PT13_9HYPH|nr:protease inhibitor Inh/omp19 family protein [Xanthobacter dioxanivorans]QRG08733.1 protease inhibitor Inh/omp19 family protein [Xanthobacter dioxanivorans]